MSARKQFVALTLAAASALAQPATPPGAQPPADEEARAPLAERLGWNARERTATGGRSLAKGDAAGARQALDGALRLRPGDATSRYNAGTGRLADGDPSASVLLDLATREAPPELAPSAWYNLGEARLAAQDFRGAADAFVESLKRRPDHAGAKRNLELALRELEKQKQQQNQQQENQQKRDQEQKSQGKDAKPPSETSENSESEKGQGEPRDPKEGPKPGEEPNEQREPERPKPGEEPNEQPEPGQTDRNGQPKEPPGALPQFRDLPDMTAEQAAAILRAVENLERQQGKERAAKAAKAARAAVEIDW